MAVAAHDFRHSGERDQPRQIELAVEMAEDHGGVFAGQRALHLALGGVAENIERGAAQSLQLRQQAERLEHPRAELALLQMPGDLVAAGDQRRRQQHLEPGIAVELLLQRLGEFAVGIKPGDFVFVLVGHQLEQALCKGLRQLRSSRVRPWPPPSGRARHRRDSASSKPRPDNRGGNPARKAMVSSSVFFAGAVPLDLKRAAVTTRCRSCAASRPQANASGSSRSRRR